MSKIENLQRITLTLFAALLLLFIVSCAKRGYPVGGPKDIDPPQVLSTKPADSSTNFVPRKKIVITFDEYIDLKDIFQELMMSPPLQENPQAVVKSKSIVIEFPNDAVFDTTTYTLSFGKSIADINEGNVLMNYEFVFSLKEYLDSMNIEGRVVNSFDHNPDKDPMLVMLYKNLNDSAPIKEKPRYASRTDEHGNFSLHNLEPGIYRLFALKDVNSNMLFDLPDEQIAFYDSLISLNAVELIEKQSSTDSLPTLVEKVEPEITSQEETGDIIFAETSDAIVFEGELGMARPAQMADPNKKPATTTVNADSLNTDSLVIPRMYIYYTEMGFFTEEQKNQYRTNESRLQPELLFFSFNQTLADSFKIVPLNCSYSADWYLADYNKNYDSLRYWITDTALIARDSLQFEISYPVYDTLFNLVNKIDTLFLVTKAEKETSKGKSRKEGLFRNNKEELIDTVKVIKRLPLTNNIKNAGAYDLDRNIEIISKTPINRVLSEKIKLFRMEDTIPVPVLFKVENNLSSMYKCILSYSPEEQTSYRVLIPDSTIFDIYSLTNDTTHLQFKTQSVDFYGILTLRVSDITEPIILQVMDEKEKIVYEKYLNQDEIVKYPFLYPNKYLLKIIVDSNGNRKWDTGNYLKMIQPERVIYYPQTINIRSNWEVDLSWKLNYK